ncbi:2-hydroxycarboxylate transporter family protein, partial [Escherichia coli]|nr:2-hydroxycarboxylate transporter family protein [Escherichia coli]
AFFAIIVLACAYFNIIPNQMIGAVAVLFAFGILIGEIGERLPIWNKFLGGGAMLCFLAAGLLKYFNLLPECVTNVSDGWIN